MATLDIKYDCHPTDGTPGEDFERFKVNAMNAASQADKRGYSLAETWLGTDEGGPAAGAPALPVNPAAVVVEATERQKGTPQERLQVYHAALPRRGDERVPLQSPFQ